MAKAKTQKFSINLALGETEYPAGTDVPIGDGKGQLPAAQAASIEAAHGAFVEGRTVAAPDPATRDLNAALAEKDAEIAALKASLEGNTDGAAKDKEIADLKASLAAKDGEIEVLKQSNAELAALLDEADRGEGDAGDAA